MNLATVNEAQLLARMVRREDRGEQARAAWAELYVRHRRYLYTVVSRSYRPFLGEEGIADLVVDTFRRAYEWAGRQKNSDEVAAQFSGRDPDSTRRKVLGWLGAIAERLFKDRFAEHATEAADFTEFLEDRKHAQAQVDERTGTIRIARLESLLATLSAADADALRLSLPWYDIDSRSFAVPRGEAARLAALLGITPDTLRQRRHRAIKKLEEQLQNSGTVEWTQGGAR